MSNDKTRNAQRKSDNGKTPPARRESSKNQEVNKPKKDAKHVDRD